MPKTPQKRPGMVDWYAPVQLLKTGASTLFSTLLGSMVDPRRILASDGELADCIFDYSNREDFTFDYLADTGDGWNGTYTMAYLATAPELRVEGEEKPIERADALILGGDEVYPVASKDSYAKRLSWPFAKAADDVRRDTGGSLPWRHAYIVPGNHDWYDGLGSMSRRYFSYFFDGFANEFGHPRKPRELGQFNTYQSRGYFVLKLPHDWEIWAVDIQLGHDLDTQQRAFFTWHSKSVGPQTKILLCSAEPTIVYGRERAESGEETDKTLAFNIKVITGLARGKGARTYALIAGDTHNYQHYAIAKTAKTAKKAKKGEKGEPYQRHHLVCGGGGAFLHPNHSFLEKKDAPGRVEAGKRYPSRDESKKLSRRILRFPLSHPGMSFFIGALYLLMFWFEGPPRLTDLPGYLVDHPGGLLLALLLIIGCGVFAGTGKRFAWGLLHGAVHIGLALVSWRAGAELAAWLQAGTWGPLVERAGAFLAGAILGGAALGVYLLTSLNWLRIHHNEAFSSLAWPHHKSMLRCTVDKEGGLTVRVIGVERTARDDAKHPVRTHLVERFTVGPEGP